MPSGTALEFAVDAAVGALSAYCYPSDTEVRGAAVQAAALVGVDYLDAVASVMESTEASADMARWHVAASFITAVATLVTTGTAQPRRDITATGLKANALGLADTEDAA